MRKAAGITPAVVKNLCFLCQAARSVYFIHCVTHSTHVGQLNPRHHLERRRRKLLDGSVCECVWQQYAGEQGSSACTHTRTRTHAHTNLSGLSAACESAPPSL